MFSRVRAELARLLFVDSQMHACSHPGLFADCNPFGSSSHNDRITHYRGTIHIRQSYMSPIKSFRSYKGNLASEMTPDAPAHRNRSAGWLPSCAQAREQSLRAGHISACAHLAHRKNTDLRAAGRGTKLPLGHEGERTSLQLVRWRCRVPNKRASPAATLLCFCWLVSRPARNQPLFAHSQFPQLSAGPRLTRCRSLPQSTLVPAFPCDVPSVCPIVSWVQPATGSKQTSKHSKQQAIPCAFPRTIHSSIRPPVRSVPANPAYHFHLGQLDIRSHRLLNLRILCQ